MRGAIHVVSQPTVTNCPLPNSGSQLTYCCFRCQSLRVVSSKAEQAAGVSRSRSPSPTPSRSRSSAPTERKEAHSAASKNLHVVENANLSATGGKPVREEKILPPEEHNAVNGMDEAAPRDAATQPGVARTGVREERGRGRGGTRRERGQGRGAVGQGKRYDRGPETDGDSGDDSNKGVGSKAKVSLATLGCEEGFVGMRELIVIAIDHR